MKREVVIEIRGGTLAGLYTNDANIDVHVVDWDDVAAGNDCQSPMLPDTLDALPVETAGMIKKPSACRSCRRL